MSILTPSKLMAFAKRLPRQSLGAAFSEAAFGLQSQQMRQIPSDPDRWACFFTSSRKENRNDPQRLEFHRRDVLDCPLSFLCAAPRGAACPCGGRIWLVGEPSPGVPACDEFYDKWEAPGVPAAMLAMFGLAREVAAANDCIDKGDVPVACKHWQGLLAVMDKMGPPLDESRGDVEKLMSEHKCESARAPESAPDSQSSPDTDSSPDSESGPSSETNPTSPE